ncbi:MAG: hypothetical protein ACHQ50_04415 [Fimbriimonadales bacterium]
MFLATLISAAVLHAQDDALVRHVTFTASAGTVESVLASLSRTAGTSLTVDGPISKDIIVLRFDDVPLNDALKNVARVTTAQWQATKSGYRLIRINRELDSMWAEIRRESRQQLSDLIPKASKAMAEAGPLTQDKVLSWLRDVDRRREAEVPELDDNARQMRDARESLADSAEARVLLKIVEGIRLDELAAICADQKDVVLATDPTALEIPLTIDPKIWPDFVAEHNASVRAYDEAYPPDAEEFFTGGLRRARPETILRNSPTKVILTLLPRLGSNPSLIIEGSFYDSNGDLMVSGTLYIQELTKTASAANDPPPKTDSPLVLSDQAREMAKLIYNGRPEIETLRPSPELRKKMFHPDDYEPLSLLASEVLLQTAKQRKENLAACLPDLAYVTVGSGADDPKSSPASILDDLNDGNTQCVEENGWLIVRPTNPVAATASRLNRRALARLLQAGAQTGSLSIDDFATFAYTTDNDESGIAGTMASVALRKDWIAAAANDWFLSKFYGSLTPEQKNSLKQGGKVFFRGLSPQQGDWIVRSLLAGIRTPFDLIQETDGTEGQASGRRTWTDLMLRPTEFLAKGLDPNGWISLKAGSEAAIDLEYRESDGQTVSESSNIEGLAMQLYVLKHPKLQSGDEHSIDQVRAHTDVELAFTFHLDIGLSVRGSLTDRIDDPGSGYALDKLPEGMRKQILELFKKFDEQVKKGEIVPPDILDGGTTGTAKPPPPRL